LRALRSDGMVMMTAPPCCRALTWITMPPRGSACVGAPQIYYLVAQMHPILSRPAHPWLLDGFRHRGSDRASVKAGGFRSRFRIAVRIRDWKIESASQPFA
jgi:hypothetical protein